MLIVMRIIYNNLYLQKKIVLLIMGIRQKLL